MLPVCIHFNTDTATSIMPIVNTIDPSMMLSAYTNYPTVILFLTPMLSVPRIYIFKNILFL